MRQSCVLLKRLAAANNYKRQPTVPASPSVEGFFLIVFFFFLAAVLAVLLSLSKSPARKDVTMREFTSKTLGKGDAMEER